LPTSLFSPFPIQKPRPDAVRLPERSPPRCCAKRRPDGQLLYRAVTVHHLTVMRRTEEQLRHAQRMESLGPLAGGLSHEVNNMMTVVLGFADLLVQAQALSDEHRTDVRQIVDAAQRASRISRQLLAYGRRQLLRPEPVMSTRWSGEWSRCSGR
jgi:signal transduction histidine kinase